MQPRDASFFAPGTKQAKINSIELFMPKTELASKPMRKITLPVHTSRFTGKYAL